MQPSLANWLRPRDQAGSLATTRILSKRILQRTTVQLGIRFAPPYWVETFVPDVMGNKPLRDLDVVTAGVETRPSEDVDLPRMGNRSPLSRSRRRKVRFAVGLDVVSVAEVTAALDRFGDRYVERVFTPQEAAYCRAGSTAAARLAVRFAAKEAAVKALQPDHRWTDWRAIEVRRHKSGRCALVLHREAASLASRRGIRQFALSMSHDGDRAAAIVIALRAATRRRER